MTGAMAGKTILIAEDEYFLAADLKRAFVAQGVTVAGPVADVDAAMTLIEEHRVDAAILDVNLAGKPSFAVADRLAAGGIAYVFLTGYDGWALPEAYRSVPRIAKPCVMDKVVATLGELTMRADVC